MGLAFRRHPFTRVTSKRTPGGPRPSSRALYHRRRRGWSPVCALAEGVSLRKNLDPVEDPLQPEPELSPTPASSSTAPVAAAAPRRRPPASPTGSSDAFDRFQAPGLDRLRELLVVPFVLVGVPLGEVGDRFVERVALAQVLGHGDRIGPVRSRGPLRMARQRG